MMSEVPPNSPTEPTEPTPTPTPVPTPTPEPAPEPSLLGGEPAPVADALAPYDPEKLTLPEGFEKNEHFSSFNEWAKEAGVSHDAAQKLIDLYSNQAKASAESAAAAWTEQNTKWQAEVKADKEVGGSNLQGVLQTISKVVDNAELTDPKFREALAFTGAGNHPAVVRTLARWAKALSEGSAVAGSPSGGNGVRPPPGESLYGPSGPRRTNPQMEHR